VCASQFDLPTRTPPMSEPLVTNDDGRSTSTKFASTSTSREDLQPEDATETTSFASKLWLRLKTTCSRQAALQWLSLLLIVASALMIWRTLVLTSQSESPVVVVLSGSMEPAFKRGDLLLLRNERRPTEIGEVVVFNVAGRPVPIVHRVLRRHENLTVGDASRLMLTKGDNNFADDVALYAPGQRWLREEHVVGRAVVFVPHIGRLTILMNDYPWFKYGLIATLGYFVVTGKD
jgi:signal peptidase